MWRCFAISNLIPPPNLTANEAGYSGGPLPNRSMYTRFISEDEFKYEMYMIGPDGKEFKTVEYIAKRKK